MTPQAGAALRVDVVAGPRAAACVRLELRAWLQGLDWPADAAADVALAVTEAVSNSVIHAYPPGRPGPVRVTATVEAAGPGRRHVELTVADEGRWRANPAGDEPSHGLASMRAMMAGAAVSRTEQGTTVLLHSTPVPSRPRSRVE